jgi:hypothetical protein
MAERVLVAGEDQVHRALGLWLVQRAAQDVGREAPPAVGIRPDEADFFVHQGVRDLLRKVKKRLPGKPLFLDDAGSLRGSPRATLFADVVRLAESVLPAGSLIFVLEDTDGKKEKIEAVKAAHAWFAEKPRKAKALVVGTPEQDAESWIVAGLAADPNLTDRRKKAKKQLSFDPCVEPERLTAAPNDALQDAKRVLAFLLGGREKLEEADSKAPDARELDELLERAFGDFDGLLKSPSAERTLLRLAVEGLREGMR